MPYNVDDLKAVVAKNTAMRQREMIEAEHLLREEKDSFIGWRESLSAIPTINQLQERANMFRQEELKKCTRKLSQNDNFSDRELEAVERLSRGIVNKGRPLMLVDIAVPRNIGSDSAEVCRRFFFSSTGLFTRR